MKNINILALEDSADDLEFITDTLLEAGIKFTIHRVEKRKEYIDALTNKDIDVIISDHFLPQFNSTQALEIFNQMGIQIPFILVTGAISEEFAVTILKQGADDYVLKSNLTRLPNAILSALKKRKVESDKIKATTTLIEKYEELIKINKELDSFVYSVSHNLRAPLASVLGLVNIAQMEDRRRDNFFHQYFSMIEQSMVKLDETLKEILDYARNARQDMVIEKIDIKRIIDENLERMHYMPGSSDVSKDVIIDEQSTLFADKYRLSVIINNLVSNAIKYHDPGKENSFLRIFIQINKDRAIMEFEDNGIGIENDYVQKVFDMFFRATEKNKGDGLGLYIVREAVGKLNGKIEVKSQIREGTLFRIEIPNNQASVEEKKESVEGKTKTVDFTLDTLHFKQLISRS